MNKTFIFTLVVIVLLLLGLASQKYDQGYAQGAEDKVEAIRENPEQYNMIPQDEVIDYIRQVYSLEDIIEFYEQ